MPRVFLLCLCMGLLPQPSMAQAPTPRTCNWGQVTGIVDGGTIDADVGGTVHRLGCIGINTAERGQPCYAEGKEATL